MHSDSIVRYQLKQEIWSWASSYQILDANGDDAFSLKGKFFSWGNDLTMLDRHGSEVARIQQTLMSFMPRYRLYRDGNLFAEIVKEFSWFKSKFTLDVPGPNDYEITGNFWEYEYKFKRIGKVVATVSKKYWTWADTYGVDIQSGEDDVSILATIAVVDLVCHENRNND